MRARRHVDEIALLVGPERIDAGEVVQGAVDFLEVPRVLEGEVVHADVRLGRHASDVGDHLVGEAPEPCLAQQLEAPDPQVFVTAQIDGGTPLAPAVRPPAVQSAAENTDDDGVHAP